MVFKYFPLGVSVSSSFALTTGTANDADNIPTTASFAQNALHPPGPSGSRYKVIYSTTDAT
jgi:hypothetical protein